MFLIHFIRSSYVRIELTVYYFVTIECLIVVSELPIKPITYHDPNFNSVKLSINAAIIQLCFLGGPYAAFGGRDASRGLATFSVTASEVEYDDLSDLSPPEMDSVREWEMQFKGETFEFILKL